MEGWIKLHRRLLEWEWYHDGNMFRLWLHLLLRASPCDRRYEGIDLKRGQLVTTMRELSEQTGLTARQLRTCIERQTNDKQIDIKTTNKNTILTICNYDRYQVVQEDERQTNDKQKVEKTTNDSRAYMNDISLSMSIEEDKKKNYYDYSAGARECVREGAYASADTCTSTQEPAADPYIARLPGEQIWMESIMRLHRVSEAEILRLIEVFAVECRANGHPVHRDLASAEFHFNNWLHRRRERERQQNQQKPRNNGTIYQSNNGQAERAAGAAGIIARLAAKDDAEVRQ